jgi:signal transduction histidine kinase
MSVIEKGSQEFQPYARLMNIIGDQLITDKKVAVIEIIKNSYDADAEKIQVRFFNMSGINDPASKKVDEPYIEIEDDGDGMTLEIIKEIWLRPATPNKLNKKKQNLSFTKKGRIIQGEKGVGRFAIHKLGEKIELYTKALKNDEVKLSLDFTEFNPEKADLFNQPTEKYRLLKEVQNHWSVNNPAEKLKKPKGTLIRIFSLRESWTAKDFTDLYKAIGKLIPPNDPNSERLKIVVETGFDIELYVNSRLYFSENVTTFDDVIERAPFELSGSINKVGELSFDYRSKVTNRRLKSKISLTPGEGLANHEYDLYSFNHWFKKIDRKPHCGSIRFSLYAYDLNNRDKTIITNSMIDFIKDNFIYVFRDGVRVYPFGEKEYDWLELDKLRSVVKAGAFPSYNDLVGFIYISQDDNPLLKDSTNRQGMMNIDGAYDDFRYSVLAATEILNAESKIDKEKRRLDMQKPLKQSDDMVLDTFSSLKKCLERIKDTETLQKANKFLDVVQKQTSLMKDRMETVEDLAGLGMAVEKASHDSLMLLSKMRGNLKDWIKRLRKDDYSKDELLSFMAILDESLEILVEEMQIIQPLFKIQRKSIQDVSLFESIEKVTKYFRRDLENKVDIKIIKDKDVIIKTNTGLILQILINIVDNAIYWVNKNGLKNKEIIFKINSANNTLIIADNGKGIREDVTPLVFNEFFSLKSNGRGLGLYIVKEILLRINADIDIIQEEKKKIASGANFFIQFNQQ